MEIEEVELKELPNLHHGQINKLALSANEEYLLSCDSYRICQWCLEDPSKALIVTNTKPQQQRKEADEQWQGLSYLTSIKFHGGWDNRFACSTKRGGLNYYDSRCSTRRHASQLLVPPAGQDGLAKCLTCISDFVFAHDPNTVLVRDYMQLHMVDLRKPGKSISRTSIFPKISTKLCELYDSWNIYDRFSLALHPNRDIVLTTHYDRSYHEISFCGQLRIQSKQFVQQESQKQELQTKQQQSTPPANLKQPIRRLDSERTSPMNRRFTAGFDAYSESEIVSSNERISESALDQRNPPFSFQPKTRCIDYNPKGHTYSVTCNNCVFTYQM